MEWNLYKGISSLHSAKVRRMKNLESMDEITRSKIRQAELIALERARSRLFDRLMEDIPSGANRLRSHVLQQWKNPHSAECAQRRAQTRASCDP